MNLSIMELMTLVYKLLNEGREEEIQKKIADWGKAENLPLQDNFKYQFFKASYLYLTGDLQESLKIAEELYKEGKKHNILFNEIDAFLLKWSNLFMLGGVFNLWEDLLSYENTLKSLLEEPRSESQHRLAFVYYMKGYHFRAINDYNNAIIHFKKSIEIFKRFDTGPLIFPLILSALGMVYTGKGELDLALKTHEESLSYSKGNYMIINIVNATSFRGIGEIYFQKGDLGTAIEYYEKSLRIWEKYPTWLAQYWVGLNYYSLIKAFLSVNSSVEVQEYLNSFKEYLKKEKLSENFYWYKLSKARILKSSSRIRNRAEAERILKELANLFPVGQVATTIVVDLCDFYIDELKQTHDLEIIDDINPFIERLLNESKRTNSYSEIAITHLLQGQLALIQMNLGDARKYLTVAQKVAEEHGLQILARAISTEHDKLLEQLDEWDVLKSKKSSIIERIEKSSLDFTLDRMQGTRALDPPELIDEKPVLLLIMGDDGVTYFDHSFIEGWDEEDLFSGFMTAFNSFSSEFFSKSIDRIKIDENIILLKPVESFMVCYVIKGQSYPALMKLTRFSDAIKWKPEIWNALNKAVKTSEMLDLDNPVALGHTINEIFI